MEPRIGVYVCHCGSNIAGTVDCAEVARYARGLDAVVVSRDYKFMCSDPGQEMIKQDIKELGLNRVVVASCSPTMHEPTYRRAIQEAGLNPYFFEMANIREHCSWVTTDTRSATDKAKALVAAAVRRVYYHQPLQSREVPINPNTLIVGGGIAGIQAGLKIADSEHTVYLVERDPSIGGHMAQLDKTFPTLDCSACILTPKMTLVRSHPYIELMTYSEVAEVSGYVGNFKVNIRRKARYVDVDNCTGCSECEKVCPVSVAHDWELGLTQRKAIYRPFPQAVPNAYTVDKSGCPPCRVTCPAGVNAQGYVALIAEGKYKEALEVLRRTMPFAGVCGRVCTHPCEGECERGKVDQPVAIRSLKRFLADYELRAGREKAEPVSLTREDKVAIVGSGPAGIACAYDLVREGYPVTVFESAPEVGGMLRYSIPEYRLPNKMVDNEISYVEELGVEIKTNTPVKKLNEVLGQGYRAVFLATGAWTSQKMGIPDEEAEGVVGALEFLKQANSGMKVELGERVAVIGGGNAAIDAARLAWRLGVKEVVIVYRRSRAEMPAIADEVDEAEREGIRLHVLAAPVRVLADSGRVSGIECIRMELGEPDASGRRRPVPVEGSEFSIAVDNVIMAIGQTVDKTMLPDGLEYSEWGTLATDPVTLETSIKGVFAGGDVVSGPADVIQAVAAGKQAAISIDRYLSGLDMKADRPAPLERVKEVNKEGVERRPRQAMPVLDLNERRGLAEVDLGFDEDTAVAEARRCLNCGICCECLECVKVCERGAIHHDMQDEYVELEVGNIILTTGFEAFDPAPIYQYGYKRLDNVVTGLEFERIVNSAGPTAGEILLNNGKHPESIALIHCVGSRDEKYHEYCSRVCCMYLMKLSHLILEHVDGARVYQFYIDIRCFGKGYEEFYNRMLNEGVTFIRGRPGEITDIAERPEEKGKLVIQFEDTLIGLQCRLPVDMVVLGVGLEAQADAESVARLFNVSRSADGFFLEKHPKLDPVATMTDGIFVAGCCQGCKDIPDTVAQASAAAAEVLAMISRGRVEIEAATAVINENICSGCQFCRLLCPYSAINFDEEKRVCRVNEALCKGCGACVAGCMSDAVTLNHYNNEQIVAELEGLLA